MTRTKFYLIQSPFRTSMKALSSFWSLIAPLILNGFWKIANARDRHPLVLISLDGCRWDYLSRAAFPTFSAFRREGVAADWVQGTFPTKTFPSHNTIVTGLRSLDINRYMRLKYFLLNSLHLGRYHENHGIIGNTIFDVDTGKKFRIGKSSSLDPYWWTYNGTLPIWVSAVQQNLKAGVYFWPGSEVSQVWFINYFTSYNYNI